MKVNTKDLILDAEFDSTENIERKVYVQICTSNYCEDEDFKIVIKEVIKQLKEVVK